MLMFWTIDKQNLHLGNALDMYLKITLSQNIQGHQKIIKKGTRKYDLMKKVIVHATTAKIKVTKIYIHLWYVCLARTNVQVKIMVIVRN